MKIHYDTILSHQTWTYIRTCTAIVIILLEYQNSLLLHSSKILYKLWYSSDKHADCHTDCSTTNYALKFFRKHTFQLFVAETFHSALQRKSSNLNSNELTDYCSCFHLFWSDGWATLCTFLSCLLSCPPWFVLNEHLSHSNRLGRWQTLMWCLRPSNVQNAFPSPADGNKKEFLLSVLIYFLDWRWQ